jgi:transposase
MSCQAATTRFGVAAATVIRWTTTLVAGLRMAGMVAPMVLDGPINGDWFAAYVRQVLVPDLNPIEKAFSRLKAMLRKAGERTVPGLWSLIGKLVDLFQPQECANYFSSCGYDPD